jgi:hypothetical protein
VVSDRTSGDLIQQSWQNSLKKADVPTLSRFWATKEDHSDKSGLLLDLVQYARHRQVEGIYVAGKR